MEPHGKIIVQKKKNIRPFAPDRASLDLMRDSRKADNPTLLDRMNARAHSGCGDIYRWLHKKHRTVKKGFAKTSASWDSVVDSMISEGVTGRGGALPNSKSVARVWVRVCADIKEAKTLEAAGRKRPIRSRPDNSWQPQEREHSTTRASQPVKLAAALPPQDRRIEPNDALPPRVSVTTPPSQGPPTEADPLTIDDLPPEARAKIEKLRRTLQEDGRKKYGHF